MFSQSLNKKKLLKRNLLPEDSDSCIKHGQLNDIRTADGVLFIIFVIILSNCVKKENI